MAEDSSPLKSGSAFWFIIFILAFSAFFYLGLWGFWNDNIKAIAISTIYLAGMVGAVVVSKGELFNLDINFKNSCLNWFLGILIGLGIAAGGKMIFSGKTLLSAVFSAATSSVPSGLFSAVSAELPLFWAKLFDNVGVPAAEEIIFLIGLPIGIIWACENLGEYYEFFKNKFLQVAAVVIICSPFFAAIHVGRADDWVFILGAITFRAVMLTIYWSDEEFDALPFWKFVPAMFLGWHMGQNIAQDGLMNFIIVLQSYWYGWIFIIIFGLFIFVALDKLFELIFFFKKSEGDSLWQNDEEPL